MTDRPEHHDDNDPEAGTGAPDVDEDQRHVLRRDNGDADNEVPSVELGGSIAEASESKAAEPEQPAGSAESAESGNENADASRSAVAIGRKKKGTTTLTNIAAGVMFALIGGFVVYNYQTGAIALDSRMTKGPGRIDGTPAGTQLASSPAYRDTLDNANQLGAEKARNDNASFMATPDEEVKQRAKPKEPKEPVEVAQAPTLPPANKNPKPKVENHTTVKKEIVHVPVETRPLGPDWKAINAMSKNMSDQAREIDDAARIEGTRKKVIVEQNLYKAPDGKPVGVEVGAGRPDTVRTALPFDTGLNAAVRDDSVRITHSQAPDNDNGNGNAHSRHRGAISSVYQADLLTTSPYYTGHLEREPALPVDVGQERGTGLSAGRDLALDPEYLFAAGDVTYAVIVNGADTDTPGPVVAKILDGSLKNARLIGTFEANDETTQMIVSFDRVVLPSGHNVDTTAYAIDATDAKLAVRSDYDGRYLQRYGATLAGAFIGGLGNALGNSGTTVVASDGATIITNPEQSTKQALYSGLGRAGNKIADDFDNLGPDGPLVSLNAGQLVGVLFLENVPRTTRK